MDFNPILLQSQIDRSINQNENIKGISSDLQQIKNTKPVGMFASDNTDFANLFKNINASSTVAERKNGTFFELSLSYLDDIRGSLKEILAFNKQHSSSLLHEFEQLGQIGNLTSQSIDFAGKVQDKKITQLLDLTREGIKNQITTRDYLKLSSGQMLNKFVDNFFAKYKKDYNFLAVRVAGNLDRVGVTYNLAPGMLRSYTYSSNQIFSKNIKSSPTILGTVFLSNIYEVLRYFALDFKAHTQGISINELTTNLVNGMKFSLRDVMVDQFKQVFYTSPIGKALSLLIVPSSILINSALSISKYFKAQEAKDKVIKKYSVNKPPDVITADAVSKVPDLLEQQRIIQLNTFDVLKNTYNLQNSLLLSLTGIRHQYESSVDEEARVYVKELGQFLTKREHAEYSKKKGQAIKKDYKKELGLFRSLFYSSNDINKNTSDIINQVDLNNQLTGANPLSSLFGGDFRNIGGVKNNINTRNADIIGTSPFKELTDTMLLVGSEIVSELRFIKAILGTSISLNAENIYYSFKRALCSASCSPGPLLLESKTKVEQSLYDSLIAAIEDSIFKIKIGAYATGGIIRRGDTGLVGERGPELITPSNRGSEIRPIADFWFDRNIFSRLISQAIDSSLVGNYIRETTRIDFHERLEALRQRRRSTDQHGPPTPDIIIDSGDRTPVPPAEKKKSLLSKVFDIVGTFLSYIPLKAVFAAGAILAAPKLIKGHLLPFLDNTVYPLISELLSKVGDWFRNQYQSSELKKIVDSIQNKLSDISNTLFGPHVTKFFEDIGNSIVSVTSSVVGQESTLYKIIYENQHLRSALERVDFAFVSGVTSLFGERVGQVASSVKQALNSIIGKILDPNRQDTVQQILQDDLKVKEATQEIKKKLDEQIPSWLTNFFLGNDFWTNATRIGVTVLLGPAIAKGVLIGTGIILVNAIKGIGKWLLVDLLWKKGIQQYVLPRLTSVLGGFFSSIFTSLRQIVITRVLPTIGPIILSSIGRVVSGAFAFLFDGFVGAFKGYKEGGISGMIGGLFKGALTSSGLAGNIIKYGIAGFVFGNIPGAIVGMLVGAGVQLLYENWDEIVDFGKDKFNAIKDAFNNLKDKIKEAIVNLIVNSNPVFKFIHEKFAEQEAKAYSPEAIAPKLEYIDHVKERQDSSTGGMEHSRLMRWLRGDKPEQIGVDGVREIGGPVNSGGYYFVGEAGPEVFLNSKNNAFQYLGLNGPELFRSKDAGYIYPIDKTETDSDSLRIKLANIQGLNQDANRSTTSNNYFPDFESIKDKVSTNLTISPFVDGIRANIKTTEEKVIERILKLRELPEVILKLDSGKYYLKFKDGFQYVVDKFEMSKLFAIIENLYNNPIVQSAKNTVSSFSNSLDIPKLLQTETFSKHLNETLFSPVNPSSSSTNSSRYINERQLNLTEAELVKHIDSSFQDMVKLVQYDSNTYYAQFNNGAFFYVNKHKMPTAYKKLDVIYNNRLYLFDSSKFNQPGEFQPPPSITDSFKDLISKSLSGTQSILDKVTSSDFIKEYGNAQNANAQMNSVLFRPDDDPNSVHGRVMQSFRNAYGSDADRIMQQHLSGTLRGDVLGSSGGMGMPVGINSGGFPGGVDSSGLPNATGGLSGIPSGAGSPAPMAKGLLPVAEGGKVSGALGVTTDQFDIYRKTVAEIESKGEYNIAGGASKKFDGAYQMGHDAKIDAAQELGIPVPSREEFRRNPQLQEKMFDAYTYRNHRTLMNNAKYRAMSPEDKLSTLGYAHNQGGGGASKWLNTGVVERDGFGTAGNVFSKAVAGNLKHNTSPNLPTLISNNGQTPGMPGSDPITGMSGPQSSHGSLDDYLSSINAPRIVSGYGPRIAPTTAGGGKGSSNHKGIDIATKTPGKSTPITPIEGGEVVFAGRRGGYGNFVEIKHADGSKSRYAHLANLDVKTGQKVDGSTQLGMMGTTGNSSGVHLHLETLNSKGEHVNPKEFLQNRPTQFTPQDPKITGIDPNGIPVDMTSLGADIQGAPKFASANMGVADYTDYNSPENMIRGIDSQSPNLAGLSAKSTANVPSKDIVSDNTAGLSELPAKSAANVPSKDIISSNNGFDLRGYSAKPTNLHSLKSMFSGIGDMFKSAQSDSLLTNIVSGQRGSLLNSIGDMFKPQQNNGLLTNIVSDQRNSPFGTLERARNAILNPPQTQFDLGQLSIDNLKSQAESAISNSRMIGNSIANSMQGMFGEMGQGSVATPGINPMGGQSSDYQTHHEPSPVSGMSPSVYNDLAPTPVDPLGDSLIDTLFSLLPASMIHTIRNQAVESRNHNYFDNSFSDTLI